MPPMDNQLEELRQQIDHLDERLLRLLIERFTCLEKVANYKKTQKLPIFYPQREQEQAQNLNKQMETLNVNKLNQENILAIFQKILQESKKAQQRLID